MVKYISRPCGQAAKTQPSQGWIPGSIPGWVTIKSQTEPCRLNDIGSFFIYADNRNDIALIQNLMTLCAKQINRKIVRFFVYGHDFIGTINHQARFNF